MNFEEYVKDEFKKGEKKFDKIESDLDIMKDQLIKIYIAIEVDKQLRDGRTRRNAVLYSGLTSLIVGIILHFAKGVF